MPPQLNETHREVQALAREIADRELAPRAAELNERHEIPRDAIAALAETGLLGVTIPEEYGGPGLDATSLCLVVEEIARADAGTSVAVAVQNGLVASPLVRAGTDEQKARWLPRLASGELIGCYALTEPEAGSDTASLRTRAERAGGGGWSISGSKQWITNGGFADLFVLFARTGGREGEAVRVVGGGAGRRRGRADARRQRLFRPLPRGAVLPGREDHGDLRGHQRDPAPRDRPRPAGRRRPGLTGLRPPPPGRGGMAGSP